ncbi:gamma-glutamyl hydrolase-like precursor [Acyrthosiphon pisum]|uniref:folate gamma-glutamyl hydrolase n=1 Tax=Acyrthosiphon pisum TaxID=7029 RepID=C4WV96_ACYPI|nr:gamma-glutamyl hydrolase-like precursor [Acyrthosiphon pisum]BAH71816.1 ACYPI008145 [Acyrthosiphon pisum]|eukprot:NP_001192053.1 gamma-glutamyl hydrolase-like precursor [Acyrthosiphon pisum]
MYLPVILTLILSFVTNLTICNERPVIGILTQEVYWSYLNHLKPYNNSYIAASYVKAIEASGGRVVPVFTNRTTEYYMDVVNKVNGILVPGGGCAFNISFGISQSTNEVFHIAKRVNDGGDHFPILGICLGFELLLIASIGGKNPLTCCNSNNVNLPLNLIPTMEEKSMLFKTMPKDIRNILLTEPVTANHHKNCITKKNFTSMELDNFWNPITLNKDENNLTFISTVEAKNYPFVGLQFHPEKNAYEWERNDPHSWSAVYSARYFCDWFVNECRKNNHEYINQSMLENELIYNYPTTYVAKLNSSFEQVYFFNE